MKIAFRVVALVGGLLFTLPQTFFLYASLADLDGQGIHIVHNHAGFAGFVMLGGIPMLLLAWRPHQVALLRLVVALAAATLIGALLGGVLMTALSIGVVFGAALVWLSPDRRAVFRLDSPNLLLLAVVFICAIPAVVEAARQGDLQGGMTTGDEHLVNFHYATMAIAYLTLVLAGAWSAFTAPAVRTARALTGLAGVVLAVGFLVNPGAVSSIDTKWATGLLVASVVYLALGEVASRASTDVS